MKSEFSFVLCLSLVIQSAVLEDQALSPINEHEFIVHSRHRRDFFSTIISHKQTADIPAYLANTNTFLILRAAASLNETELHRVFGSLSGDDIMQLANRMTQTERVQLLTIIPNQDTVSLTGKLTPEQLFLFLTSLPNQAVVSLTQKLKPEENLEIIQHLPTQGVLQLISMLPLDAVLNLILSLPPQGLSQLISILPEETVANLTLALPSQGLLQLISNLPVETVLNLTQTLPPQGVLQLISKLPVAAVLNLTQTLPSTFLKNLLPQLLPMLTQGDSTFDLMTILSPSLLAVAGNYIPKLLPALLGTVADALGSYSDPELEQCLGDLERFFRDLSSGKEWAIKMLDSYGKPGRGLLKGNTHMLGNMEECLNISEVIQSASSSSNTIKGSYCNAEIKLPSGFLPSVPAKGILPDIQLVFYACLPSTCQAPKMQSFLQDLLQPLNVSIPRVSCQQEHSLANDNAAVVTICLLAFLVALLIFGTLVDIRHVCCHKKEVQERKENCANGGSELKAKIDTTLETELSAAHESTDKKEKTQDDQAFFMTRVLLAFSLPRNTDRILAVEEEQSNSMACLHGIRVLSLAWILVGHTFFNMALYFENSLTAAEALQSVTGQVVINSTLAVDTFFVISGCLNAYHLILSMKRKTGRSKAKRMFFYYIHRYIRLTPTYAILVLVCTCLIPYMAIGPDWSRNSQSYYEKCADFWWTNILYINNFYKSYADQCLPWSWYLSADMQMYWIAPVIILPLLLGWRIFPGILILGSVIVQIALTVLFEDSVNGDYLRNSSDYIWKIFQKPYCRSAPYFLGIGLGYILAKVKHSYAISKPAVTVFWLLALAISAGSVWTIYDENQVMLQEPFYWSQGTRAAHEAIFRPAFSLSVCWIIFACSTGNGGFVNSILSWPGFLPFSRLAFGMYLLHPVIILADLWQTGAYVYFSIIYVFQRAIGYYVLSAIFAYFLSVTVETPIARLETIIFKRARVLSSED